METTDAKPRERRLADVVRDMRSAEADRLDALDREGEAARARLTLLVEELDEVFEQAGGEEAGFDFQISPGPSPRLWIDAATHVVVARDGKTYRILRDSRGGRTVLGETDDVDDAADHVTRYIATRTLERERLVDEPTVPAASRVGAAPFAANEVRGFGDPRPVGRDAPPATTVRRPSRTGRTFRALVWFLLGMLAGAALLFVAYGELLGFNNPVPANLRQYYEPYVPPAPGIGTPSLPTEAPETDGAAVTIDRPDEDAQTSDPVGAADVTAADTPANDTDASDTTADDPQRTPPEDPDFETVPVETPNEGTAQ